MRLRLQLAFEVSPGSVPKTVFHVVALNLFPDELSGWPWFEGSADKPGAQWITRLELRMAPRAAKVRSG
jgi:hypothetical protein